MNPAISVGLLVGKRFPASDLLPYVIAQVLGGMAGGGVLYIIASGKAGFNASAGFASNGYGLHSPGGYSLQACLVAEIVLTFMFLMIILGATDKRAPQGFAPIAIGLGLTLIHLIGIPVTNLSVNPAPQHRRGCLRWRVGRRAALVILDSADRGAAIAGIVYSALFTEEVPRPAWLVLLPREICWNYWGAPAPRTGAQVRRSPSSQSSVAPDDGLIHGTTGRVQLPDSKCSAGNFPQCCKSSQSRVACTASISTGGLQAIWLERAQALPCGVERYRGGAASRRTRVEGRPPTTMETRPAGWSCRDRSVYEPVNSFPTATIRLIRAMPRARIANRTSKSRGGKLNRPTTRESSRCTHGDARSPKSICKVNDPSVSSPHPCVAIARPSALPADGWRLLQHREQQTEQHHHAKTTRY